MQLDFTSRELTIKLVYYGPALSGKTTNLQALHMAAAGDAKGRLMTLETKDDRTLFFDLLPLRFEDECGLAVRLKVFTVPGQVIHASTRRLVVQGADGVAFVADSRRSQTAASAEAFVDLRNNLEAQGIQLENMPLVIQFNKRDLPDIRREEEISAMARRGREPVYLAVATKGQGVVECFLGLLHLTWADLEAKHQLERKFGFDGNNFVRRVAEKLGQRAPVTDLLGRTLGDATRVAREVAPQ
ncbi:MAG: gliding motility protein [Myxococcales bacterium]|nr:gliding motility protein [Myxococcales bacterium]